MRFTASLLTLAAASAPLYAQQPAEPQPSANPLPALMAEAQAPDTTTPAAQLAQAFPLLALMPSDAMFAMEFNTPKSPSEPFSSGAIATSGDLQPGFRLMRLDLLSTELMPYSFTMPDPEAVDAAKLTDEEKERLKTFRQLSALYDTWLAEARSGGISLAPIYIALRMNEDEWEPEELTAILDELCGTPESCCSPLEYKGWRGLRFRLGDFAANDLADRVPDHAGSLAKAIAEREEQWAKLVEGYSLCVLTRQEGDLLMVCICEKPEDMQWAASPEQSVLSDASLAKVKLLPGEGTLRQAALVKAPMLASMRDMFTDIAKLSGMTRSPYASDSDRDEMSALCEVVGALTSRDLCFVAQYRGKEVSARLDCGLSFDVNFRPGALPGLATLDDQTAIYLATSPVEIKFPGVQGVAADILTSLKEGAAAVAKLPQDDEEPEMALSCGTGDLPALTRLLDQMGGSNLDLSKSFTFTPFGESLPCMGRIVDGRLLLSTSKSAEERLTATASASPAFSGIAFSLRDEPLYDLMREIPAAKELLFPMSRSSAKDGDVISGVLTVKDRCLSLRLSGTLSELAERDEMAAPEPSAIEPAHETDEDVEAEGADVPEDADEAAEGAEPEAAPDAA